ncbi:MULTISPECIES: oligogalacturonate lyase [Brenneria]|uniref:Oligogalacturonate lyase n=1 Tax=Brenneria nigrifluens DSM 30175 = ATCC 13028 TaxID=1121120 RepID=A0A2U1UT02_9GAMM|nr:MULTISPECIES: oligogalacturonate lyase [Brenneria]EHD21692.1 Oligogalacturonide lyase [Brenneria sp. EniD312]PWC24770.1 oligogalacturonate lyase [Brenneria nigrifluens] [Brenneria nigrifluens DSM 30175 = ATCC 13028]QCR04807.1 oligogalacturonate lyase [Brenneria nigrifluens] [Brenneria nigrifluens DSM 30175 = ATCC 13028]
MAKGNKFSLAFHTYQDSVTGTEVVRLTPPDVICHRNYFYQKCFTRDASKLLFGGAFDGPWNYYLLDLKTRQATQLTEGEGDNTFGGFLSPDDEALYYVKNGRDLRRVDLQTLEEKRIYQVPEDWVGYGTWVANSDCSKMVGIEISKEDWQPLTDWKKFQAFYFTNPCCRLIRIDLSSGKAATILQENRWLGHPIYRPGDDNTVAFCHEGPHDLVDARMWFINEDGGNMRKVKEHAPGESCTHEFWVPDGSALIYVSYHKGNSHRYICSVDPVTLENRRLTAMPPCSHLMSNFDGSLLVGDGSDAPVDVQDDGGYKIENDPFLYVFNMRTGQRHRVAQHNTSWKVLQGDRQVTHPHPSFTPDDKQILFTSDADGKPALYLARVPDAVRH